MKRTYLSLMIGGILGLYSVNSLADPASSKPPVPVQVETIKTQVIQASDTLMGEVKGSASVDLKTKVSGYLARKLIQDGARVSKGQVLFELDPVDFELAVAKARAQTAVAQAAYDLARTELERVTGLYRNKAISRQELETASATKLMRDAELASAKAVLAQEEQKLKETRVLAPFDGVVSEAKVNVGDLVQAQATTLVRLTQVNPLWVEVGVSEQTYSRLFGDGKDQGQITITVNGKDISAPIIYESPEIDSQLGSIKLRAEFNNADLDIKPGIFIRAKVLGQKLSGAAVVPQKAVFVTDTGHLVYLESFGKAQARPVEAGEWREDGTWVLMSGLSDGDRIITSAQMKLYPGAQVVDAKILAEAKKGEQ